MSARPHPRPRDGLLQRLRRWWLAAGLRSRLAQLDMLINQIEADMQTDVVVLHACRFERRTLAMRLQACRLAQQRHHPRPEIDQ